MFFGQYIGVQPFADPLSPKLSPLVPWVEICADDISWTDLIKPVTAISLVPADPTQIWADIVKPVTVATVIEPDDATWLIEKKSPSGQIIERC